MIGPNYWSVGIVVYALPSREDPNRWRWRGYLDFLDDGWVGDGDASLLRASTEGRLKVRYPIDSIGDNDDALPAVIDVLIADAKRLGVEFKGFAGYENPAVFYRGDGENQDAPPPPNWYELINAQNERLGWEFRYKTTRKGQQGENESSALS